MTKLTVSQASIVLNLSIPQINKLIRDRVLKAAKLDPAKVTSPYCITRKEIERYRKVHKPCMRATKRCEPCKHVLKKACASCQRLICIKDYRLTRHHMPSAKCKDCENKRKLEKKA